ncbi:MAG TPA: cytochrome C biosynthesis protein [Phycisphaerae bacterium]|jgi:hypothetical protein|nr:cytochrome C biosynthesis protein [Phycisphaerae bacterium]HOJ53426.1 cytochrome C biosynthesis protein [Phycisphaerae bacterium]HOL25450.1 cytochrome C biosynthesis protein [Phycisphaerae bacterium]HPP19873.1 cytochrome C biosynthesis protein [Phycisphaerae bacterium]HPU31201.1 cytochrome C biosynthesis protein [Phycisphaerae bacterium]
MKLRWFIRVATFIIPALMALIALFRLADDGLGRPSNHVRTDRFPAISPDYANLVIPPNIAPLNFVIQEPGTEFRVFIFGLRGPGITVNSRRPRITIPLQDWRALLEANTGASIRVEVFTREDGRQWIGFKPLVHTVANEPIDGYLVYRRIDPVFRCWGNISIQQRDLTSFNETCLLANRSVQYDCINCHSFSREHPDRMALLVRSEAIGPRMLLSTERGNTAVSTATKSNPLPSSYHAWHPNGRVIAFAAMRVTQFFHAVGETRDVFDLVSDLGLYVLDSHMVTTAPAISRPDRLETYPAWSPDGKFLYFCSAPQLPIERYREVRYDLLRIPYDPQSGDWGEPETLLSADDLGGSITHPRISPDGRFLMFCRCDYGNFSIYRPESDLYLLDLETRATHKMELNSDRSDSYHTWSSNGRWVVFSSKRRDGLLTHPWVSYVDKNGRAHKPFILPQQDPEYYDFSLKVFNVPELSAHPLHGHADRLRDAFRHSADPPQAAFEPTTQPGGSADPEPPWHAPAGHPQ